MRLCHDQSGTAQLNVGAQDIQHQLFMLDHLYPVYPTAASSTSAAQAATAGAKPNLLLEIQRVVSQLHNVSFSNAS